MKVMKYTQKPPMLNQRLWLLKSKPLAAKIQKALVGVGFRDRGVKQAELEKPLFRFLIIPLVGILYLIYLHSLKDAGYLDSVVVLTHA